MKSKIRLGLTFDDVLLVPKKSNIKSRKQVDVRTILTKNIKMNIPLMSANMDTVTEHKMAIVMARRGGIGIIHRFLTIEEQVSEVLKVKRSESLVVEDPYTLFDTKTVAEAKKFMLGVGVNGLLVVNRKQRFVGVLSRRDVLFANDDENISEVMTRNNKLVTVSKNVGINEAKKILHKHRIEKLPIIDKNGAIKGLITSTDIRKIEQHPFALKDEKGKLMVGAAVGVKENDLLRAKALVKAGVDVLVVDIAHGHSKLAIDMIKKIRKEIGKIDIIAGNVATPDGTKDLILAGADAVKIGVGPGSICITRIVSGSGVPQLSAVIGCAKVAKKYGVPIIADGGIKTSGDLAKAIAAGANSVMCGNLFAGTKESPGNTIHKNGRKFKVTRGMASFGAGLGRQAKTGDDFSETVPEGIEALVPYKGSATEVIGQLIGGLRSGISYCGARNIKEMQKNAGFIRITDGGLRESKPHDVELV